MYQRGYAIGSEHRDKGVDVALGRVAGGGGGELGVLLSRGGTGRGLSLILCRWGFRWMLRLEVCRMRDLLLVRSTSLVMNR